MVSSDYRAIIESVLSNCANIDAHNEVLFDREHDCYCVLSVGWDGELHVHSCLIHIDVNGDKIWIQRNNTEDGIAAELEAVVVPKSSIVLGFKSPAIRQYTGYAVA